jgi:hypothetical protein
MVPYEMPHLPECATPWQEPNGAGLLPLALPLNRAVWIEEYIVEMKTDCLATPVHPPPLIDRRWHVIATLLQDRYGKPTTKREYGILDTEADAVAWQSREEAVMLASALSALERMPAG